MDSINQVGAERRKESRQNVQNRVNSNREQVENIDTDYIGQNKKIILRNKSRECRTKEDTINSNTSEKMQEYATGGNVTEGGTWQPSVQLAYGSNSVEKDLGPALNQSFSYLAPMECNFTKAVSHISSNHSSISDSGEVKTNKESTVDLINLIQRALVAGINLNKPQQNHQQPLRYALTSKAARGDMRLLLRARSEIYGKCIDPNLFVQNADLGEKANTISCRNKARAMLAGAPLMAAQLELMDLRKNLNQGNDSVLTQLLMDKTTTVADVLNKLRAAPPLAVLKLCNPDLGDLIAGSVLQLIDDLDFTQDILSASSNYLKINPILHCVLAGLKRRSIYGSFKHGNHSVEVDRLRFVNTGTTLDDDLCVKEIVKGRKNFSTKRRDKRYCCRYYQTQYGCRNSRGDCGFLHECSICKSTSHGSWQCRSKTHNRTKRDVDSKGYGKSSYNESRRRKAKSFRHSSR